MMQTKAAQRIRPLAPREQMPKAALLGELMDKGLQSTVPTKESTGDAFLRLAKVGEQFGGDAPADLSSRIDDYLYGEE